jgi:hypothetical protein
MSLALFRQLLVKVPLVSMLFEFITYFGNSAFILRKSARGSFTW